MDTVVNSRLDSGTPAPTPTPTTTTATSTSAATTSPPATSTTSTTTTAAATTPAVQTFEEKLAATMKRIASHATKVETLKNGAKLYFLPNGREVEQVEGKTPYVVAKGTVPAPKAAHAATTPSTATTPAATPATGSAGSGSSSGTTTPGK